MLPYYVGNPKRDPNLENYPFEMLSLGFGLLDFGFAKGLRFPWSCEDAGLGFRGFSV